MKSQLFDKKTAKEMWDFLELTCSTQNKYNKGIIRLKMEKYVPKKEYTGTKIFDDSNELRIELNAVVEGPSDAAFIENVLSTLPAQFNPYTAVWRSEDKLTPDELRMKIIGADSVFNFENNKKDNRPEKKQQKDVAMDFQERKPWTPGQFQRGNKRPSFTVNYRGNFRGNNRASASFRGRSRGGRGNNSNSTDHRSDRNCYECNSPGHFAAVCPQKDEGSENTRPQNKNQRGKRQPHVTMGFLTD